jgi:hypothetical protein
VLLKINGTQVTYTLEKETSLGQVVQGVSDWLAGSGMVVTAVRAEGADLLSLPRGQWAGRPLAAVPELDVTVHNAADLRIEHWQTLHAWLGMLAEEVRAPGPELDELCATLAQTMEDARENPFENDGAGSLGRLAEAFRGQSASDVRRWTAEQKRRTGALIEELRARVAARIRQASQPAEALVGCVATLRASLPRLAEVPVQLATGRDGPAMQTVASVAETLQTLLALVPFLPPHPDRPVLFDELTGVFRDVIAAFDAKDTVLLGDLLEYEAAPRIAALLPLLETAAP